MKYTLIGLIALLMTLIATPRSAAEPIRPPELKPGDTIALVAPSRGQPAERIQYITDRLEAMGFHVWPAPNIEEQWGYLAGRDEDRAAGIMDAWRNPEVDGIFCIIGGYGATRILDLLDYEYMRENPKVLTGFSDITGLHLAVHKRAGLVTYHSPTSQYAYGAVMEERPFMVRSFWRTVAPGVYTTATGEPLPEGPITYDSDSVTTPIATLVPGVARGRLVGGNLSLIHALMGTPYEIETDGALLFIEDVSEEPYRVDRMLSTLQLAGKLENPAGVIIGMFTRGEPSNPERSFTVEEVFGQYFGHRSYPVVTSFPVGHVRENATMPIGVMAELDADERRLTLLEPTVEAAP